MAFLGGLFGGNTAGNQAGNLSALGMLTAEVRHDLVRTRLAMVDAIDPAALEADFQELLAQGARALAQEQSWEFAQ